MLKAAFLWHQARPYFSHPTPDSPVHKAWWLSVTETMRTPACPPPKPHLPQSDQGHLNLSETSWN